MKTTKMVCTDISTFEVMTVNVNFLNSSPPYENISTWTWGDYRWFVTGKVLMDDIYTIKRY